MHVIIFKKFYCRILIRSNFLLIKSDCTQIRRLFGRLSPCSKTWKLPFFRPFQPDTQILSALAALYWPSTAFYWPSTTKYQPVPLLTDPSCINYYRPLLIQYHQVPTSIDPYWPSIIIYEPVPLHTDPVPSCINQYRLLLTQYHQVPTATAF